MEGYAGCRIFQFEIRMSGRRRGGHLEAKGELWVDMEIRNDARGDGIRCACLVG